MVKVGITERGDAGLDFTWVDKLLPLNIIITKNLNDQIIEHLIKHKEKIILHTTCTGMGGSRLEPNVPNVIYTHSQTHKLIGNGFPVNQIVLRIDPIIPTEKGIVLVEHILDRFQDTGIKRVRYSFLDMYPHVKERIIKAGLKLPYNTFCCSDEMKKNALHLLIQYEDIYELEACAENTKHLMGCVSKKDFDIMGIRAEDVEPVGFQRKGCMCIAGKTELLSSKKRCSHGCLYCYWKD